MGQTGVQSRLTRRILADASGQHLTEDDLVDLLGGDPGARQQRLEHDGADLGRGQGGQAAAEGADRGPAGVDDDDVLAHGVGVLSV